MAVTGLAVAILATSSGSFSFFPAFAAVDVDASKNRHQGNDNAQHMRIVVLFVPIFSHSFVVTP